MAGVVNELDTVLDTRNLALVGSVARLPCPIEFLDRLRLYRAAQKAIECLRLTESSV